MKMDAPPPLPHHIRLDGRTATLVIGTAGGVASAIYWGPRLPADTDLASLDAVSARAEAPASPAEVPVIGLTPQAGFGWPGRPGLAAHRAGQGWASRAVLQTVAVNSGRARFTAVDPVTAVTLVHDLVLAADDDVLVASTTLTNNGDTALWVESLAAPVLPVAGHLDQIISFEGRWAGEFQTSRAPRTMGTWLRENRRGRTSHDSFPAFILAESSATETGGAVQGFHLGWSGNHRLAVETLHDGRALVMAEALYLPGESSLAPGDSLASPPLFIGTGTAGLSGLSQAFHQHLRARPEHQRLRAKPRPVHYNSWEAVYFDHQPDRLMTLATRAAAVGVDRFVLDDGWFKGRRHDRAGLGDWIVDSGIYPEGLAPLVTHVESLGMEFGLWIEPEMVNQDSDLFRAYPDWVLGIEGARQLDFRHQLVLDFGRAEVRDHLFGAIDALLRDNRIAYLKWDMNRDLNHPGGNDGRAGADAHVRGVYAVLDRLRAAHPFVEIESCASGGGRADYGILARTDRIWTSDSNDALDRLAIQRGFSHFFPAELMGAHVGPARCHITGRRLSMGLRVATAMFGHMGMELDLGELDDSAMAELAAGVALHKGHRQLIHSGRLFRIDHPQLSAFAIVSEDGLEALVSATMLAEPRTSFTAPLRLPGLDPAGVYTIDRIWPQRLPWPLAPLPLVNGAVLASAGLQLPRLHPETAVVLHLTRQ
jgi:alpha-galactosidase